MKIYVVTRGEYSDYGIEHVFISKEKADLYCKWHCECRIEEYETHDDNLSDEIINKTPYIFVRYNLYNKNFIESDTIYIEFRLVNNKHMKIETQYMIDNNSHQIILRRKISMNDSERKLEEKYLKVCRDLMSEVKQMYVDGFTEEQIKESIANR